MKLQDKVAIVTGAGSGMGEAIAKRYAKEGAKVVLADLNEANLKRVVSEIEEAGGVAIGVLANVAKEEDVERLVDETMKAYGKLSILVNNAGIMDNFKTVGSLDDETWDKVIAVNLTGPMKLSRAALKVMTEAQEGVIINNASIGGLFGARGGAAYVASKHGLIGLTKNMAVTHGKDGKIRVNGIAPGAVNTHIGETITAPDPLGMEIIQQTGQSLTAEADQIAGVALFLASNDASFVNGHIIVADGGWTAR
ncbi:glucose 1-dehydrogenase [Exiguobacterium flavidum]|uniref:glucose 1-dehydrogenase n=1 Tax=Exiguobacterium flavidum TaxID=2184695 RepID=UPI000DF7C925|nr:glucose 1-dehydrogenase [Exiguobacterium flavidum]